MTFIKNKEDFVCENCSHEVKGTGYTNHCPKCLYSKHVDINPGDRAHSCNSIMEPVSVEKEGQEHILIHKCVRCGEEKRCKIAKDDDFNKVVEVSKNLQN